MTGKLYLCGTPIGNLEDITLRVIKVLKEADLIAAEDTRQTLKLLNHMGIKKPMISYHEHNRFERGKQLIDKLKQGLDIALVTDAGMPGISDPGEDIVKSCIDEGIEVIPVPGATASITALVVSGFSTDKFVFEGFLPRENRERKIRINSLKNETRTTILYEAPHRIKSTLKELYLKLGNRRVAICRELTKKFEQIYRITLFEASTMYDDCKPRGEYVIVLEGKPMEEVISEQRERWDDISISEHISMYVNQGMSKKDAMKRAAKDRGISKREVYRLSLDEQGNENRT